MDKPTLIFKSAIPQGAVLTYAFTDSTPGAKPVKFSLAQDGTMEHNCGDDVPPWTVAYYVNDDKQGQLLSQGQFQVQQGDSTITVSHGYYSTVAPSSASSPAGAWAADTDDASPSSTAAGSSSLPQAGATSAVSAEQAAGFSAPHADAAAIVVPPQRSLHADIADFVQQAQLQTQWCWAAVASSVAAFYAPPNPEFSQCRLACWATGADSCCTDGSSTVCNQPQLQSQALQHVGHRRTSSSGRLSFSEIRTEIDAGRPIAVTVHWAGGGGHAVVISGYATLQNRAYVRVQDPAGAATALVALDDFPNGGTWNWTVTTRA
ncbi:papain-like cysteine protease family protein [Xanthomonas sp. D-109]|uniref:papain-like cysteine protease family protein n=1 Tax=Xanthomonas sp. D-109 TaxID=2821274 RepID=UPI001ADC07B1|nr:papain-like cysteine protease family protein [Xanthomonas sp. D-109]MBO9880836.1 C39 family peptidase [Xanthomonas sp. D-109]